MLPLGGDARAEPLRATAIRDQARTQRGHRGTGAVGRRARALELDGRRVTAHHGDKETKRQKEKYLEEEMRGGDRNIKVRDGRLIIYKQDKMILFYFIVSFYLIIVYL